MSLWDRITGAGREIDQIKNGAGFVSEETLAEPPPPVEEPKQNYYQEVIAPLVAQAEAEYLAERDQILESFITEHQNQVDGFEFDCIRHGDFLTLLVTRKANELVTSNHDEPSLTHFSTTINLGNVNRIDLVRGKQPHMAGEATYTLNNQVGDLYKEYDIGGEVTGPPLNGGRYVVVANVNKQIADRQFVREDYTGKEPHYVSFGRGRPAIEHTTKGVPKQAVDDVIWFRWMNLGLLVPTGLGEQVRDRITTVLEEGFIPKGLAKQ